jgi:threonine/homoserine/homoserine lactone efflux protein
MGGAQARHGGRGLVRQLDIHFLFQGILIGLSIAAPVGPIGVLCIRRTLSEGRGTGFVSGLGAATADAIYGCVAGFGLTFISDILVSQQTWFRLVGGLFLCYLGIRNFLARPVERAASVGGQGLAGAYASTFILTLTNPMTILSFAAIFAGTRLPYWSWASSPAPLPGGSSSAASRARSGPDSTHARCGG